VTQSILSSPNGGPLFASRLTLANSKTIPNDVGVYCGVVKGKIYMFGLFKAKTPLTQLCESAGKSIRRGKATADSTEFYSLLLLHVAGLLISEKKIQRAYGKNIDIVAAEAIMYAYREFSERLNQEAPSPETRTAWQSELKLAGESLKSTINRLSPRVNISVRWDEADSDSARDGVDSLVARLLREYPRPKPGKTEADLDVLCSAMKRHLKTDAMYVLARYVETPVRQAAN